MLDRLPAEVLTIIVRQVERRGDIKSLCEVSRGVYRVAAPILYESLILPTSGTALDSLIDTIDRLPLSLLAGTKHVVITAPDTPYQVPPCIHRWGDGRVCSIGDLNRTEDDLTVQLSRLGQALRLLFSHLRTHNLRTFRWELGCVPSQLLDGDDLPLRTQSQIEDLALVTDPACPHLREHSNLGLSHLSKLHSLSWEGIQRYEEFESIRQCISANGQNLRTLKLDLFFWPGARSLYNQEFIEHQHQYSPGDDPAPAPVPPDDFFATCVLNIEPGTKRVIFPALRELVLSEVSFRTRGPEMIHALNVGHLTSLTLRNCSWTSSWLAAIAYRSRPLHLRKFELKYSPFLGELGDPLQWRLAQHLPLFLRCFTGLEDLCLMLYEPIALKSLAPAILHHAQTLRRLVIHCTVQGVGIFFSYDRIDETLPALLGGLELECAGLYISAPNLQGVLAQCAPRPRWKLLHLRTGSNWSPRSRDDVVAQQTHRCNVEVVHNFARWAFGPEGLPELQVLVYGGFLHATRNSPFNVLLCRSEEGYHDLTRADETAWALFGENMDLLTACPLGMCNSN